MLVADEMDRIGVRRNQIIESDMYYDLCRDFEAMVFDWLADEYVGQRCQAGLIVKRPDLLPSIVAVCRSYIEEDKRQEANRMADEIRKDETLRLAKNADKRARRSEIIAIVSIIATSILGILKILQYWLK